MYIVENLKKKQKGEKKSLFWCFSFQSFTVYTHVHTCAILCILSLFSVKGQIVNVFGFADLMVSCQLRHCSRKRNGWGGVPIKLHVQKQVAVLSYSLLILLLNNLQQLERILLYKSPIVGYLIFCTTGMSPSFMHIHNHLEMISRCGIAFLEVHSILKFFILTYLSSCPPGRT